MIAPANQYERPPTNLAGYDPTRDADGFSWSREKARNAVDFFADCCIITKGPKAGKPFLLEPWQADYVATLFGWVRPNGTRRYRESLFAVPRKNGKTETGAGIALKTLCADGERGAQIFSAAKDREQAGLLYEPAQQMVIHSRLLQKRLTYIDSKKRITHQASGSYYQALSRDSGQAHGRNPHCVLFDEVHTQPNRSLYDALRTGQGARAQPLFINMTTAGTERTSICYEVWQHARNVRDGMVRDPEFLPLIYELAEGEPWDSEATWTRCNPNLGVTVAMDFLRGECERAKSIPAYENTFRNLYLNQWTEQATRWFAMADWDACQTRIDWKALEGEPCWAGLDMSTTTDLSAFVLAFPRDDGTVLLKPHLWIPEDTARKREKTDRRPYRHWRDLGLITFTPGTSVDYDFVRAHINKIREQYAIQEIAFDPWNATQLAAQLQDQDGFVMTKHGQGFGAMTASCKEFERRIVGHSLRHDGHEVLRDHANNVAVDMDPAGNLRPNKQRSNGRIDGIVASIMAIGRAVTNCEQASFYESNELEVG